MRDLRPLPSLSAIDKRRDRLRTVQNCHKGPGKVSRPKQYGCMRAKKLDRMKPRPYHIAFGALVRGTTQMGCVFYSLAALPVGALTFSAGASDLAVPPAQPAPSDWIITLGADARAVNRPPGDDVRPASDVYRIKDDPAVSLGCLRHQVLALDALPTLSSLLRYEPGPPSGATNLWGVATLLSALVRGNGAAPWHG
jgi:hypothetical protein